MTDHPIEELLSVARAARALLESAHRKGPTSDEYWADCTALETALANLDKLP